ncbi:cell division topological specificity factor MinE, partial [Acidithiobacillus ferrooxidans]|nr:cell division topological specificity factor MinE [Acidithiobacillus ferrooxidans]
MSFLDYFLGSRKKSANVAKDRLKLILAHERDADGPDFLPALQEELLA